MIHRLGCHQIAHLVDQEDQLISVEWNKQVKTKFRVRILLSMDNRPGILGRVATTTGFCDSNIENIQFDQTAPGEHIAVIDLSGQPRSIVKSSMGSNQWHSQDPQV